MKEHATNDVSHDDKHDCEIAAIALALESDPEFASRVRSTPLSELPTILADEGFTGNTLVEEFVNLLAQAIDEQVVETNGLDRQSLYKMSLHEIQSEAPGLLSHIVTRIAPPGSSEQTSINSIAGGQSKTEPPSNQSHKQRKTEVEIGLGLAFAGVVYAVWKYGLHDGQCGPGITEEIESNRELDLDARRASDHVERDLDDSQFFDATSKTSESSDLDNTQYFDAKSEFPDDIVINEERSAVTDGKDDVVDVDSDIAETADL
jgi:hypothetical protein